MKRYPERLMCILFGHLWRVNPETLVPYCGRCYPYA